MLSIRTVVVFLISIKISKNERREKIIFDIVKLLARIQNTEFEKQKFIIQNLKPKIQNLVSRYQDSIPWFLNLEYRIWIQYPESRIFNLESNL